MSPGCGRDVQRRRRRRSALVAADDVPRRRRDVGAVEVVDEAAAATAADPARPGRSGSSRSRRPGTSAPGRTARPARSSGWRTSLSGAGRPTVVERRRRRTSRTPVRFGAVGGGAARSRSSGASAGMPPSLSAASLRGVAVVLVDELEVAAAARVDHVHRRPVVVVGVHPQAGLLVVLGERLAVTLAVTVHSAARRRLGDDVLGARAGLVDRAVVDRQVQLRRPRR